VCLNIWHNMKPSIRISTEAPFEVQSYYLNIQSVSHRKQRVSMAILFTKIMAVCSENHTEPMSKVDAK
jgi:hypothetical protein